MVAEITALDPEYDLQVVMDKRFFSTRNINNLLEPEKGIHFLASVPFTSPLAKRQMESERKDIDRIANTILTKDGTIRGVHKLHSWGNKQRRQAPCFCVFQS